MEGSLIRVGDTKGEKWTSPGRFEWMSMSRIQGCILGFRYSSLRAFSGVFN